MPRKAPKKKAVAKKPAVTATPADSAAPAAAPSQAMHHPVHAPARELHTADLRTAEPPPPDINHRSEVIVPVEQTKLTPEYIAELAFMEDPITIRIEPSDDENAPIVVDCWVQGKGAEVFDPIAKKWLELNCLPIGGIIITKRKYVEVLARSRADKVVAKEVESRPAPGTDGWKVDRRMVRKTLFSVIHDPSPKGAEWLTRLYAER